MDYTEQIAAIDAHLDTLIDRNNNLNHLLETVQDAGALAYHYTEQAALRAEYSAWQSARINFENRNKPLEV